VRAADKLAGTNALQTDALQTDALQIGALRMGTLRMGTLRTGTLTDPDFVTVAARLGSRQRRTLPAVAAGETPFDGMLPTACLRRHAINDKSSMRSPVVAIERDPHPRIADTAFLRNFTE
jgi:hypothetical protein